MREQKHCKSGTEGRAAREIESQDWYQPCEELQIPLVSEAVLKWDLTRM